MFYARNEVINLTQTSMYHLECDNYKNILRLWSTNSYTPFLMLRLARCAFLTIKYQLVSNAQGIIHASSNQINEQDYEEYHIKDYDIKGDTRVVL